MRRDSVVWASRNLNVADRKEREDRWKGQERRGASDNSVIKGNRKVEGGGEEWHQTNVSE